MNQLKEFLIQFSGLKLGKHQFEFDLDNSFFVNFGYEEFNSAQIKVKLTLDKKSTMLELSFSHSGIINLPCDISNENFDLSVKGKMRLLVKFGESFNDENEELIILPHGEYQINLAQYVFEMVVLSIPAKRIHPGIKDGTLDSEAMKNLEKYAPKIEKEIITEEEIDPRWSALKKLLTDKK